MQTVEAQRGASTRSHLFDSLKVYLNNKNRLQPIIGLGSIIECVKAGSRNSEVLYLCEVCVCRLTKADMRNHIMGSLHRYNYIKARHPHFVSEFEKCDLSKLAWPLMEMAKILEGREGPGEVQWLEVDDAVYQKMATHCEKDAVTLISILRDGQGEAESLEHTLIQSQRIVLLSQKQQRQSKKPLKTSGETDQTVAFIKSEDCLDNASSEPSELSENGNSFLDGYTGTKPLIGFSRVVECRSEDGHTCCFLCHCCRIRSNKKDIIDHLTRSSHLINYLMEVHPEQVEVMMADVNDNHHLLQSLAEEVQQEEGRAELQVVNIPESLCSLLTSKSYHWCVKMLCNGGTHTNIQKQKIAVKGPGVNKTSNQCMPEKCAVVPSKSAKTRTAKRKMMEVTNTVFNVSLPLTKGSLLLERSSFSTDSLSMSPEYSPPSDSVLVQSPESQSQLEYDTGSFTADNAQHSSQPQQHLYSGNADAGQYMEPEINVTVTPRPEVDGYFNDFRQSENITGANYQNVYGESNYNGQNGSQDRSSKRFYKEWQNNGPQTQHEWPSPAVSHTQDWSSHNSSYGREAGCTQQWYNSSSQSKVDTGVSRGGQNKISSDAALHYYQQPQNQYMAQDHTRLQTGSVGQQGLSGELAAYSGAASINMHPHAADSRAHSGSIALEPREQFLEFEQKQSQTYIEFNVGRFQTASQSYMTQPTAHQSFYAGYGMMYYPNYNTGQRTNPAQHYAHPVSGWGGSGGLSQSNAFIPPGQALYY